MSLEEKRRALQSSKHFEEARAEEIRFTGESDVKVVIFPANWSEQMKDEEYPYFDKETKEQKTGTKTIYYVFSPNAINPHILKKLEAKPGLNGKIRQCLNGAIDQGWEGAIIATIAMTRLPTYTGWSVKGQKYEDDLPDMQGWQEHDSKT